MAKYYNTSIAKDVQRIFNFKQADTLSPDVGNIIVPVMPIQRVCDIVKSVISSSVQATIYTTPTNADFYLSSCTCGVIKDVTSTSTSSSIIIQINGLAVRVIAIPGLSLTAQQNVTSVSFPIPIKCDRNSTITINSSTAVANILNSGQIIGYLVETQTAE
jgi:hypothetical protein